MPLTSYIPERHRAACERRWNGPIPQEALEAGRIHPGARAYALEAWRVVRFHAKRALAARRRRDLLDRATSESHLSAALLTWEAARDEERRDEKRMGRAAE